MKKTRPMKKHAELRGERAFLTAAFAAGMALAATAVPTISIDSVAQRWPWNNKVDITYTIENGQDLANGIYYKVVFEVDAAGTKYTIDGSDDVIAKAGTGTHKVTWTMPGDIKPTNCKMVAKLYETTGDYMIVDLNTGAYAFQDLAEGETPALCQTNSNTRYNTALYKTTNSVGECRMALRRIPKGGPYPTGDNTHFATSNRETTWNTDRDYFIGIFKVTGFQFRKLGGTTCGGSTESMNSRPALFSNWDNLRSWQSPDTDLGKNASSASWFERLNAKTGMRGFDLPTEVMWEIAARAMTAGTTYWWGNDASQRTSYMTAKASYPATGTKLPNAWGVYDMAGACFEWCRDGASLVDQADAADPFTPAPFRENESPAKIRMRGGTHPNSDWSNTDTQWYVSYRGSSTRNYNNIYAWNTFRAAWYYVGD